MPQRPIGRDRSHSVEREINIFISLFFFAAFYLYICFRISPRLLYYKNPELFLLDSEFFKNFLLYPGGVVDYISKFFLEFYYFNWPGALIITLFTFLICVGYSLFLKNTVEKNAGILFFIPAALLLIIYNRYSSLSLIGLLLALISANIYIKISDEKGKLFRIFLYVILSIFIYYCAVYFYWLFTAFCAIWEIVKHKKYLLGWLYLGIEIFIYYINAQYVLLISKSGIFYYLFPFFSSPHLWLRLSLLALLIILIFIIFVKLRAKPVIFALPVLAIIFFQFWLEPFANKLLYGFFLLMPILAFIIQKWNKALVLSLIILSLLAVIFTFNRDTHSFLKINYFSQNKIWEGVLREARKIPLKSYEKNPSLYEIVFKALYHCGYLPYKQFDYPHFMLLNLPFPQPDVGGIFTNINPIETSDTVFSLGLINHSELMAFWALDAGNEPVRIIQQLALIYILKGNNQAAQVLLNRLKETLLYKKWARKYESILENNALLENDPYLTEAKARMIKSDDPKDGKFLIKIAYKYDYEGVFKRLLRENKNNRMAFEYLMAYYLLTGQTEKIIENLEYLNNFGYPDIPRNYQEAILMHSFKTGYIDPKLKEKIDPLLETDYRYFDVVYRRLNYDKIATYNALKEKYGNSYFLYYTMLTKR